MQQSSVAALQEMARCDSISGLERIEKSPIAGSL
jgi:hypothetical protein